MAIAEAEPESQYSIIGVNRSPRETGCDRCPQIDVFELVLLEFSAYVPAPGVKRVRGIRCTAYRLIGRVVVVLFGCLIRAIKAQLILFADERHASDDVRRPFVGVAALAGQIGADLVRPVAYIEQRLRRRCEAGYP